MLRVHSVVSIGPMGLQQPGTGALMFRSQDKTTILSRTAKTENPITFLGGSSADFTPAPVVIILLWRGAALRSGAVAVL